MQVDGHPRLLVTAHGTESVAGSATTTALVAAIAAAAPDVPVELCFLDVVVPSLTQALDAADGPTVVVPLLLSTGYHVQTDIPAIADGRPRVRVARHLGPDPLVVSALVDRLRIPADADVDADARVSTVLVGVGSSRPEARPELDTARKRLVARLASPVQAMTLFEDVAATLVQLPPPVRVASYLLAEGRFHDRLLAAADGRADVSPPIGAHPRLVELVLARYARAAAALR
jgi:sirohydrochlorin ferrochelatase